MQCKQSERPECGSCFIQMGSVTCPNSNVDMENVPTGKNIQIQPQSDKILMRKLLRLKDPDAFKRAVRNGSTDEFWESDRELYSEPSHPVLDSVLEKLSVVYATACIPGVDNPNETLVFNYFGDVCQYVKDDVENCQGCTYQITKDNFILQKGFLCKTCHPLDRNTAYCSYCSENNHNCHDKEEIYVHMFCDTPQS